MSKTDPATIRATCIPETNDCLRPLDKASNTGPEPTPTAGRPSPPFVACSKMVALTAADKPS